MNNIRFSLWSVWYSLQWEQYPSENHCEQANTIINKTDNVRGNIWQATAVINDGDDDDGSYQLAK